MTTRKILIVDDNLALSQMLKQQLEASGGFAVQVENRSTAALDAVRKFRPDLVVMDVMMPEVDGGQIVSAMREDRQLAKIPVVFLTGTVRKEEVERRRGTIGGMPFLAKPVRLEEILSWINKLVPIAPTAAMAAARANAARG
ncbi:MAG: response regulator [Verrucomicrobia bacterium]|nr:response regulator [Verrucomicrobiota bacterium]